VLEYSDYYREAFLLSKDDDSQSTPPADQSQIEIASSTAFKRSQVKPLIDCVSFVPFDYYEYEERL
jgi:hypothetical protein